MNCERKSWHFLNKDGINGVKRVEEVEMLLSLRLLDEIESRLLEEIESSLKEIGSVKTRKFICITAAEIEKLSSFDALPFEVKYRSPRLPN